MVSEVILFTYKSGEIDNFLNRFYSSSSFINNNSYIKLSELIAAFSDNNTLFDIDMWISLDKDVFIKISPLNADIIIKYIFERYPYWFYAILLLSSFAYWSVTSLISPDEILAISHRTSCSFNNLILVHVLSFSTFLLIK